MLVEDAVLRVVGLHEARAKRTEGRGAVVVVVAVAVAVMDE